MSKLIIHDEISRKKGKPLLYYSLRFTSTGHTDKHRRVNLKEIHLTISDKSFVGGKECKPYDSIICKGDTIELNHQIRTKYPDGSKVPACAFNDKDKVMKILGRS